MATYSLPYVISTNSVGHLTFINDDLVTLLGAVNTIDSKAVYTAGNLSPLFTTSVASNTLSFTADTFTANTFYGNSTGSTALPTATAIGLTNLPAIANGTF